MTVKALLRCPWPGIVDEGYARYHDCEWGVPQAESAALFEKLVLESFQSGLSWLTILRKREAFRAAFHGFDAARMARYTARDVDRLMVDEGIVRNRAKIEASIANARAYVSLSARVPFATFLWSLLDGAPVVNRFATMKEVPPQTEASKRLSKALKAEGFVFVGPTTAYAFMQAMGFVNDHLISCHRHAACARLMHAFEPPLR